MTDLEQDFVRYTAEFAAKQAEQDTFDDAFGIPRTNLAWIKSVEMERFRSPPPWDAQKAQFKFALAQRYYAAAVGLALA